MPGAESARRVLCTDGQSVAVRFDHKQVEGKGADGRQVRRSLESCPEMFSALPGEKFGPLQVVF